MLYVLNQKVNTKDATNPAYWGSSDTVKKCDKRNSHAYGTYLPSFQSPFFEIMGVVLPLHLKYHVQNYRIQFLVLNINNDIIFSSMNHAKSSSQIRINLISKLFGSWVNQICASNEDKCP